MTCPKCGSPTNVTDTVSRNCHTSRKRVCTECKHVFFTSEIIDPSAQDRLFTLRYRYPHRKVNKG